MKLTPTLGADSANVQALDMGRIIVDVDGIDPAELNNKVAENGYSPHVVDTSEQQTTGSSLPSTVLTDIRLLQYRTHYGKGQRLTVLTVTPDE